jgi:predicted metal-binding membrane protein
VEIEALVRRDRAIAAAGVVALALLAWAYLIRLAGRMDTMGLAPAASAAMPMAAPSGAGQFGLTTLMWVVMMVAMMVPAASPMIVTFATVNRRRAASGTPPVPTAVFLTGYLVTWSAFSLLAASAQWGLQRAALLAPATLEAAPRVGGVLLLAAGVYQFTPLKRACLARCQSPVGFVLTEWREGPRGAFIMGLRHGAFCVGCCWALMALLFAAGVMNLLWVAALAALVLAEKLVPSERLTSWTAGVLLFAWAGWVLARSF